MNKKQLYESIMKNVAKEVKKTLNEKVNLEEIDITADEERWEEYLSDYIQKNIEKDGKLCAIMFMIYGHEVNEDEIKDWLDDIMHTIENLYLEGKYYEPVFVDEVFIDAMASFLFNSNFVEELIEELKSNVL